MTFARYILIVAAAVLGYYALNSGNVHGFDLTVFGVTFAILLFFVYGFVRTLLRR